MKDITIEEAVKDLKSLVEEYKDASVEGLNMQVDVGFNEDRCRNLEKILNELEIYKHYYEELTTGQVTSAQLLKKYVSRDELEKYKELYVRTLGRTLNNSITQSDKAKDDLEALNEGWKIECEKKDKQINLYKKLYENLQQDFEAYKNDKDINYLDRNHHKQLVDKSIGQIIDKPEECWFDIFEVKVIKDNKLLGVAIRDDFVNLKQISDEDPDNCITVIAESPLSGAIYRYNNNGQKEWQLIGTMLGYA